MENRLLITETELPGQVPLNRPFVNPICELKVKVLQQCNGNLAAAKEMFEWVIEGLIKN